MISVIPNSFFEFLFGSAQSNMAENVNGRKKIVNFSCARLDRTTNEVCWAAHAMLHEKLKAETSVHSKDFVAVASFNCTKLMRTTPLTKSKINKKRCNLEASLKPRGTPPKPIFHCTNELNLSTKRDNIHAPICTPVTTTPETYSKPLIMFAAGDLPWLPKVHRAPLVPGQPVSPSEHLSQVPVFPGSFLVADLSIQRIRQLLHEPQVPL